MSDTPLKFAGEFDPATDETWRMLVEKALAGRDFDKVMSSETYDGIRINGLYTADNAHIEGRPETRQGNWAIVVPHWNPDAKASNSAILEDLERGATGVALRLQAGRFPGITAENLPQALEGVHLNMASFTLVPGEEFAKSSKILLSLLEQGDYSPSTIQGRLGVDPIGVLAQTGRLLTDVDTANEEAVAIATQVAENFSHIRTFSVDSGAYHMAGATEAQELGVLIATGIYYLRVMEAAGLPLEVAAGQIAFSMAADADVSLTLAKFRAARHMWATVLKECGVQNTSMYLSGVTSLRMVSVKDPWVNILRATAACFGAGVGGADDLCVLPHDTMLGMSSNFARRIARNIQIILQEESGLARVEDPAAGSFAFESITSDLCLKAWDYFRKIESAGGIQKVLEAGVLQENLRTAWALRRNDLAKRKVAVTGVSEFPDICEKAISDVGDLPPVPAAIKPAGAQIEAVEFHRLAEDFEQLRMVSDVYLENEGRKPKAFLANIGTPADFTARATFAKNFFEAGGIETVSGQGSVNISDLVSEFRQSGARLAVLCSTDQQYSEHAQALAASLKDAGAYVVLAGRPSDADELKASGVAAFIYVGCDVLEMLTHTYEVLGESE